MIPDRHIPTLILPTSIPHSLKLPLLPILSSDTTPTLSRLLVLKRLQRVSSTTDTIKTTILPARHCLLRPLATAVLLSSNQLYLPLLNSLPLRCLPTILPHRLRLRTVSTEVLLSVATRQLCESFGLLSFSLHHLIDRFITYCPRPPLHASKQKDRR